jgi:hypothetical protein
MKDKDWFLLVGVVIGGIMWGSITSLIENNGFIAIFGLAFSSLVMGGALGAVGHKVVSNDE